MIEVTTTTHDAWPAAMLGLLERQHSLVGELVRLAQTQALLIDAHRTEDLLEVLARRQALIDEFTLSHGQMTQLTQRLDESLQRAHPDQRLRIQALIDEIGESLAKVMSTDHADQQSLSRSKDQMKQELGSMDAAKQARNAYLGPRQRNPRFADRRG